MNKFQVLLVVVASVAATALAPESLAADKALRAGAFAIDITPTKLPVPISGGILPRFGSNLNDPLHARCLVLDDGQGQIAIAIVDSLLISRG
jgi:neutral ceramidase